MIAVAAAGGIVGVAVNAAVLMVFSDVQAVMAGDVGEGKQLYRRS